MVVTYSNDLRLTTNVITLLRPYGNCLLAPVFFVINQGFTLIHHSRDLEDCGWCEDCGKKIHFKTSQNSLHNNVTVLVR